jgi:hypothetical protein
MAATIFSHPAIVRNRFYKEPKRCDVKVLAPCMKMHNSDFSPDEMEIERAQRCSEMEDEEELPF